MLDFAALADYAKGVGFGWIGAAPVAPVGGGWFAPHVDRLTSWIEAGRHAEMHWIAERAGERIVPEQLLPGVRGAIVLALPHRTPDLPRPEHATGRVAAYAWGRDYHNVARKQLRKILRWLRAEAPGVRTFQSIDTGPVLERAWAERAALGWIGRSTMLIHPRWGTFASLAVIFIDQPLAWASEAHPYRCGTCDACVVACPTGALDANGLDARRCISYWTIEHRGLVPADVRPWLGEWVFGCDICQDVCPWNREAPRADPARWAPMGDRAWPDLVAWLDASADDLATRLAGSPLQRAGANGLRRNALIVLANQRAYAALPAVERRLLDPDPVIRATAVWAARVLGSAIAIEAARADLDPLVRAEATSPLPPTDGCGTHTGETMAPANKEIP